MAKRLRIHDKLLSWYDTNKRDLPWRANRDPYAVWVSEIMLQQTQVETVRPYFRRWLIRFPDAATLAKADEQEVLSYWQGLGYYRRCRMLHAGAKHVAENGFPANAKEWKKVPGVGKYTAGAIASISQGEKAHLVDGNVERVFARLAGNDSSGKKLHDGAWDWAEQSIHPFRPGDWNQALMELGATVCRPTAPQCNICPLADECVANRENLQSSLPTKTAAKKTKEMDEQVWVTHHDGSFGLRQIPEGKWWQGMWEFARAENENDLTNLVGKGRLEAAGNFAYHVTNHKIRMTVSLHHTPKKSQSLTWYRFKELEHLPMPAPQRKALQLALARLKSPELPLDEPK